MAVSRRSLVKGSLGVASALVVPGVISRRSVGAQSPSYEVSDFFTFEEHISFGDSRYWGTFNDLTNGGAIGGAIVVSDKYSPSVWSPDGKIKRYKTDEFGGSIYSLNDNGVAVGAIFGETTTAPAFWRKGKAREVALPSDLKSENITGTINSVNDEDVAVGAVSLEADDGTKVQRALIWNHDGEVSDLPVPEGASELFVTSINATGTTVGSLVAPRDLNIAGSRVIVVWGDGEPALLENLDDYLDSEWAVYAAGISADGQVLANIGRQYGQSLALIYDRGTPSRLPFLKKDHVDTFATSISDNGLILGYSGDWKGEMTPTLWSDGNPQDLTELIADMQGFEFRDLGDINNDGLITATATITVEGTSGYVHGLVLRPA